ncbi:DUF1810 domain-containing protein [Myxococcota bacterium]|nr:DUF1810 domain-containing protein [Myxococcota bacterium]
MVELQASDPHDLQRFIEAQANVYDIAFAEISNGRKRSHWMWYIFPQIEGLGYSDMAQRYAISGAEEARAYLEHPLLGERLQRICEVVLATEGRSMFDVFGSPDDLKLRSCATLFSAISPENSVFHRIIEKHYEQEMDARTLVILEAQQRQA